MSIFNKIDTKLAELSNMLGGKLTKDRPDYPQALRTFEERRIDWIENDIHKAIIIQPTFETTGVNLKKWSFINIAWKDNGKTVRKYKWLKFLIEKGEFDLINNNINDLIKESIDNLTKITLEDLK